MILLTKEAQSYHLKGFELPGKVPAALSEDHKPSQVLKPYLLLFKLSFFLPVTTLGFILTESRSYINFILH